MSFEWLKCDMVVCSPREETDEEKRRMETAYSIPREKMREQTLTRKKCHQCKKEFVAKRAHACCCSPKCRKRLSREMRGE